MGCGYTILWGLNVPMMRGCYFEFYDSLGRVKVVIDLDLRRGDYIIPESEWRRVTRSATVTDAVFE